MVQKFEIDEILQDKIKYQNLEETLKGWVPCQFQTIEDQIKRN